MEKCRKILIISDLGIKPVKLYLDQMPKLAKGFIRLGHDVRHFNYGGTLSAMSPLKSRRFAKFFCKSKVDSALAEMAKHYYPHIVYVSFAKYVDGNTINILRSILPDATFIGGDGDPWPKLQKDGRIETAKKLDILTATNDGQFLQDYKDAGVRLCVFMPNMCDPDIDHRYKVEPKWKTDILWTGRIEHHADTSETFRKELVQRLAKQKNCSIYGCLGRPQIGGIDYLYAISGAKIGVNVNAYGSVKFCHSDRLTHYLACGVFVMAKKFEGCNLLYKDSVHLKYFDTIDEFFDLAEWYLNHETERKKIADEGMKWVHEQFNSLKIAKYILDLIETGTYNAPWFNDQ